ncbi:MAG: efflux RND transporter permease subunit [Gemmatimonadota bacterium]
MSLPALAVRRPVAVSMVFVAVILLGGISFLRLPIDLLPEVSYPRLVVYTAYPEVAPAEVERLITERVEAQGAAVPGVQNVTSVSRDGVSLVTLRFAWGTDMDFALLNVRERMDNLREALPEGAQRPRILRVDPDAEPILTLSVVGGGDLWATKELAETVFRRRLEQLDGVAQAAVSGGLDREIQVEVNPALLESYGLELSDVARALEQANVSAPGGTVMQGQFRYPLRTLGEFRTVDEMGEVVVGRQAAPTDEAAVDGWRLIRLRDVAQVVDGAAERETITRFNGTESVGILLFKEAGANTVAVARAVEEVLDQLRTEVPGVQVEVASSQAGFIAESIDNVVQALLFGGLLAFLVLFFFLRDPRYPFAVALAIPISVVGTFALLDAFGVSMNIMSLGGLALGVGMLVDNSIVVLENVFRHREEGKGIMAAASEGAREVQGAITASTLTTISVFGPIIYVEGVAGELFRDLSLAVAFSLLVSLLVALTLLPSMAARFRLGEVLEARPTPAAFPVVRGRRIRGVFALPGWLLGRFVHFVGELARFWGWGVARGAGAVFGPLLRAFDRGFQRFAEWYHRVLDSALDRKALTLGVAVGALGAAALVGLALDRDLLPQVDQGAFDVRVELPEGTALARTQEVAAVLEARILADEAVDAVFARVGRDVRAYAEGEETTGLHTAQLQVRLDPRVSTDQVLDRLRTDLETAVPGARISVETGQATALGRLLGGSDADIAVRIRGQDLDAAHAHAELLQERLQGVERVGNVRLASELGQPQLQVEIQREEAARYGLEPRVIAEAVEQAMRGALATEFVDFDRRIDVLVRLPEELRTSAATLNDLRVQGVPLREVIRVQEAMGPVEIRREDQGRVVTVHADVLSGGLARAIGALDEVLATVATPAGLRVEVGGENEEMRRSFQDLAFAFGLALFLVYMILAAQFESFRHPFTILGAVPLALVGAVLALALAGQGLNTMSLIGLVILVGIVVNDSIIKVDFIHQARGRGVPTREAILEAGRVRLRPILMTTATTVLGLTPMALGIGRGADLRAPLAVAVIGGLLVATLLTLIVVPVLYAVVEGQGGEGSFEREAPPRSQPRESPP